MRRNKKIKSIKNIGTMNPKKTPPRRRRVKSYFSRFLKLRFLIFLFIVFISIIVGVVLKMDLLTVRNVQVLGEVSCAQKAEIVKTSDILGKIYFSLDEDRAKGSIQKRFLCVKDVKVEKSLLQDSKISVSERAPALIVRNLPEKKPVFLNELEATPSSDTAKLFQLDFSLQDADLSLNLLSDPNGLIYETPADTLNLPVVYIEGENLKLGDLIKNNRIEPTVFILNKLSEQGLYIKSAKIVGKNLLIDSDIQMIFALQKDPSYQIASLQLILQKAKIDSGSLFSQSKTMKLQSLRSVDLRFDKAVVVYSP